MPDKTPTQTALQVVTGRDLSALLRELYVERRWTDQEIADHLSGVSEIVVSRSTVRTWRADFGIERSARRAVA